MKKEDVIQKLRADPTYRLAMASVKDEAAKLLISTTAEAFVSSFFDALVPVILAANAKDEGEPDGD